MVDNVVDLSGKQVTLAGNTNPTIIEILENALLAAKSGHMAAVAVVTIMADRNAATVYEVDYGYSTELLGCTCVLQSRQLRNIQDA